MSSLRRRLAALEAARNQAQRVESIHVRHMLAETGELVSDRRITIAAGVIVADRIVSGPAIA